MTLPDRLRAGIAQRHTAIEKTPLATAMLEGTIDRETYVWWLTQMQAIHTALESEIKTNAFFELMPLFRQINRAETVRTDLKFFSDSPSPTCEPVIEQFANTIQEWSAQSPWKLLGILYVLEGSRMGSLVLAKPIARALGVPMSPGHGLDYHIDQAAQRPRHWQMFRGQLAEIPVTPEQLADIQEVANETMACLCELYSQPLVGQLMAI